MIGLIFGENNFPIAILKKIKQKNIKYLIIDLTRKKNFKKGNRSYAVSIVQFGKIIKILKKNKCKSYSRTLGFYFPISFKSNIINL